jgi:SAM-dependent methyltransferase
MATPVPATYAAEWDACWEHHEAQPWYPDEQLVRFLARYVARRVGFAPDAVSHYENLRPTALDLGCGKGRHVVLMRELGIEAYGLDVSEKAIAFAQDWLASRGEHADLRVGSMTDLAYPDAHFDCVISHGVFDHALKAVRDAAIAEVERVLKPGGWFFVSLISERDSAFADGTEIEDRTWLVSAGFERDIPQAFFDQPRIREELARFDFESIVICECEALEGRSLIGTDKHYVRDSRYYVTAKRRA